MECKRKEKYWNKKKQEEEEWEKDWGRLKENIPKGQKKKKYELLSAEHFFKWPPFSIRTLFIPFSPIVCEFP